jgi:FKBP-type peptidyl-prolyl cis-trans isomerase
MGRRRKRDPEFDDALEADYVRQRRRDASGDDRDDVVGGDGDDKAANDTAVLDKADKNRLKKARRKERQKEKTLERKDATAAAADQAQSARDEKLQWQEEVKAEQRQSKQGGTSAWLMTRLGVKYQDVVVGTGPLVRDRQTVRVKYKLRASNFTTGKVIDSSSNFGFRLGKGEVIKGWDIGLAGMKQGGRRRMIVPPQAGYGVGRDVGAGKGGLLYFDVTLLR